jgi:replicative DNA helicase
LAAVKEYVAALPRWVAGEFLGALPDTLGELPAAAVEAAAEAERAAQTRQDVERLTRKAETDLRKGREEGAPPATMAALLRHTAEGLEALAVTTRLSPVGLGEILDAAAGLGEGRYCGWGKLEEMGWRLRPAELTVVASRPGCGKTTFLSNLVVNVLKDPGAGPVLLIQAELAPWQAFAFLLAPFSAGRPGGRPGWSTGEIIGQFMRGALEEELQEAALALERQAAGRLYLVTEPLTAGAIAAYAATLEKDHGQPLALVGVDYLELLQTDGKPETAELRVSAIADGLLAVAKEKRVPVVALSQFNREASESGGGMVEMLRYSDRVGALASTVLSLAVPEDKNENTIDLEVAARKNRYGPKNQKAFLSWDRGRGYIYE